MSIGWLLYMAVRLVVTPYASLAFLRVDTVGSHLSCTAVKPDSCLARIFFPKIGFPFPV